MTEIVESRDQTSKGKAAGRTLVYLALGLLVFGWLLSTPPGLLGKADAVGYAVCHRIDHRSLHLGERAASLCARCSGMYLGALLALGYQAVLGRRRTGVLKLGMNIILGLLLVFFAVDGVNSLVQLIAGKGLLYTTTNSIRMYAGMGMGIAIGTVLYPAYMQTIWARYSERESIEAWPQFVGMLGLGVGLSLLALTENPLVLYPLSLLSSASVLLLLTMVYSMVLLMVFRRENSIERISQLLLPSAGGLLLALVQVSLITAARWWLTGTWAGFPVFAGG